MAKFCLSKSPIDFVNHTVKHGRIIYLGSCHDHASPIFTNASHSMSNNASSKLGEETLEGPDLSDFIAGVVPR